MSDLQCAWLLLLFCAASRANYVRVVHPALSFQFAVQHDVGIRQCLQDLLHVPVTQGMWEMAGLPFASGGLCLRNAERLRTTAYWASWADTLPMIRPRHPEVADHMVLSLSHGRGGFHSEGAAECRDRLVAAGIDAPEWGVVDPPGFHPDDEFPTYVDFISSNVNSSRQEALLYVVEDNEAVIKMIIKGRSPTVRHVSRTHRVALDWSIDRFNLDPKIQI